MNEAFTLRRQSANGSVEQKVINDKFCALICCTLLYFTLVRKHKTFYFNRIVYLNLLNHIDYVNQ